MGYGERGRSRTLNLQSRNLTLYPIELRVPKFLLCKYRKNILILNYEIKNFYYFFYFQSNKLP